MLERHRIVELWRRGHAQALVTLVGVEGSSYRRPGARMLIGSDGSWAGSVSGGCLEAEVVRKAAWLTRRGAVVERYSTLLMTRQRFLMDWAAGVRLTCCWSRLARRSSLR